MYLLCGLGNKDFKYLNTRHNAGYLVIDRFSQRYSIPFSKKICSSIVGIKDEVIIAKPDTYMNLSGGPVSALVKTFNIKNEEIIIIHDDLDLELGRIKIKWDGGDGGHKGIKSIIEALGSKEFYRLKVGIGRDPTMPPADYVLSDFKREEIESINRVLDLATDALYVFIHEGTEKAMSIYNKKMPLFP